MVQFTPAYNVTGQAAISLPLYLNGAGLTMGAKRGLDQDGKPVQRTLRAA
jgi:hypothetical protein